MEHMIDAGMRTRWRYRTLTAQQEAALDPLCQALNVSPLLAQLLAMRDLTDPQAAHTFLNPSLKELHDPGALPNVDKAAQRIEQAVRDGQPIVIYGDYDVDGITASSILWHVLSAAGANVQTYVPHRIEEGYGLNSQAIAELANPADGHKPLIISVDCGITATEPAQVAKDAGVDLIITDHHQFDADALPNAFALVHPSLPGSAYPFPHLCGAGVAFKLAWQFARVHCGSERLPDTFRDLVLDLLSLAALGTVADIVPLVGENRLITRFGLGQIKRTRITGLNALIDAANLRTEKIDAYHVGFVLGPRLNACGRMGHAKHAVHLLTKAESDEATEIAQFLTSENESRRKTEKEIFEQAKQRVIDDGYDQPTCRAIVVGNEGWHPGVVGIVASRLVDAFCRPAIVLNIDNGEAHGSARSVDGVSIHEALTACGGHLTSFGGHEMAAGLRLRSEALNDFRAALVEFINNQLPEDELSPVVDIDACCQLHELPVEQVHQIDRIAPFGRDNHRPIFSIEGAKVTRAPIRMGQGGKHAKVHLEQNNANAAAIGWSMGDLADQIVAGDLIDLAFEPKINTWQGRTSVDLIIKDVRKSDPANIA